MLYLAYGSNLHPLRLSERAPSASLLGTAILPGWTLHFHKRGQDGSAKCNIVRAGPTESVYGAVFEIDRTDLQALDTAEGLGNGYEHHHLELAGYGRALTYMASESHIDQSLSPYQWYKEYVLLGCEYHEMHERYVAGIRTLPHCDDPNRERHRENMTLVEKMRTIVRPRPTPS